MVGKDPVFQSRDVPAVINLRIVLGTSYTGESPLLLHSSQGNLQVVVIL
jgi:hypothetical protein